MDAFKAALTSLGIVALAVSSMPDGADAQESLAVFRTVERLGRDWPRTLVTYEMEFEQGAAQGDSFYLVDGAGLRHACQLSHVNRYDDGSIKSARVSFFAELPSGGSYHYELKAGAGPAVANAPAAVEARGSLLLENGITGIRMPSKGKVTPAQPLLFGSSQVEMVKLYGTQAENGIAPGPFQGVRLHNNEWVGGSYFWASNPADAPKVTEYECTVTESGPLFTEAQIRYTFDNGGWYIFPARMIAGDPAVRIDEQFDMGIGNGHQWRVVTSLSRGWQAKGWKPDSTFWMTSEGRVPGNDEELDAKLAALDLPVKQYQNRSFGSRSFAYDQPYQKLFDLEVWNPWHSAVQYFAAVQSADLSKPRAEIPFIAIVPMHAGNWRGNHANGRTMVFAHQADDFNVHWQFMADGHPRSLLHTGEYDTDLPFSLVRRQWALVAGPLQYHEALFQFRKYEGYVNLDNYKEWILDWQADEEITYPRLVFGRDDVERLAETLDDHPGADVLKQHLYFNDDPARAENLFSALSGSNVWGGPRGQLYQALDAGGDAHMPWTSHYRHTQMANWAGNMDELLSSEHLASEQRNQLRAYLAGLCNVLSEPDVNPRGSMMHLGNPNMPMNRFFALTFAAALIPDHPRAKMNVAPLGTWSELISYFGASAPHLMQAAAVLERTGRLSDKTAELAALPARFTLQLMSPVDPRFGTRIIPNWGHEGSTIGTHWMVAAALMRNRNPQLATALTWAWDQLGRPMTEHHDAGFSPRVIMHADLLSTLRPNYVPAELRSTWLPGFGAVMRAHTGHPDETFLAYRQGYMVSHCDDNQGDFVLYSKGAPLVVMSIFAYPTHQHEPYIDLHRNFGWHSHVRCGSRAGRIGGWNASSHVHAFGFGDAADYVRGAKQQGDQNWTRQILFMKAARAGGPDYFIFRDSFTKAEPVWWTLRTSGTPEQIQPNANGFRYNSQFGQKLDVRFLQPTSMPLESREASRTGNLYHQAGINWRKAGSPTENEGTNAQVTETITFNSAGPAPAGTDIISVLSPLGKDETTPPKGTDYVFVSSEPINFSQGEIAFEGIAGAVRLRGNKVHLIVSEGPAKVSCSNLVLESAIPVQREFGVNETQTVTIPAPPRVGVYDVEDDGTRITGKMSGVSGGFHILTAPDWLDRLAVLVIDGQTYAPGTAGNQFIIPVLPGDHDFELRMLPQPPIWRNPLQW